MLLGDRGSAGRAGTGAQSPPPPGKPPGSLNADAGPWAGRQLAVLRSGLQSPSRREGSSGKPACGLLVLPSNGGEGVGRSVRKLPGVQLFLRLVVVSLHKKLNRFLLIV